MSVKKRGLGKGLSALISEEVLTEDKSTNESVINIDINLIIPNENQPRQDFDKEALDDLANSIKIYGVIQPITVRKFNDKYELIAGERRWRASKIAGLREIPCLIKDVTEEASTQIALIENIQREDLNPIEEAIAYKNLGENYNLTQEEIAKQVGKSRSYVANTMRLLNLHKEIINYISKGELTSGHGKVLLGIKDKGQQLMAAEKIIKNNLNVRETENLSNNKKASAKKIINKKSKAPYIQDIEEDLMRILGTKVNLVMGNNKGKIEIEYYGEEDLERIIEVLTS